MRKFFDRGDVVFLDFDPSLGHEQKGRRPALILQKRFSMNNCEWLVLRRSLEEALWLETAASLLLCKEQA